MDIDYDKLAAKNYLSSPSFSNTEVSLLAALRSHTLRGVKCNFKNMYQDTNCPLKCWEPDRSPLKDTQEHILSCSQLKLDTHALANSKISYSDIYSDVSKQKAVVSLFNQLLDRREEILQQDESTNPPVPNWTLALNSAVLAQFCTFGNNTCNVPALGIK